MSRSWRNRWWLIAVGVLLACKSERTSPAPEASPVREVAAEKRDAVLLPPSSPHPSASAPQLEPLPVCRTEGLDALSAARRYYDDGRHAEALSCAAQASALFPDNPLAHSERGAALAALGRLEEAKTAYARALALEPDHADALLGAAHLYTVKLPSSRELDELGSIYAEHGLAIAEEAEDARLTVEFALLSAMAFNDLGVAKEALDRATRVLELDPGEREAKYERAIALFELCEFEEARAAFEKMTGDPDRAAHAHHHLGLLLERDGKWKEAEQHFARARGMAPEEFPEPQLLSEQAFRAEVARAVASLPEDMRADLQGVPVTTEEIPRTDDLLGGEPPLSPLILGLFRGPPLGEPCDGSETPCRSVALYRRNLARAVRSRAELVEQIRVTLLHEVGHLRGEDDHELAARGLE